jgi:hypothetical protein
MEYLKKYLEGSQNLSLESNSVFQIAHNIAQVKAKLINFLLFGEIQEAKTDLDRRFPAVRMTNKSPIT